MQFMLIFINHLHFAHKKDSRNSNKNYSEDDICRMLDFLIDNIFLMFGERVFQQTADIPMRSNCAPIFADLFLYSYEAHFILSLL